MTTDTTELAQREKFEAWFKSSFHPDKTGPYIKDQLYFAWKAAGADLVEALERAQQRIADAVELLKKAAPAVLADNSGPNGPLAGRMKSPVIPDGWQVEAEKLAEMHGVSFVLFRHGEAPQCADPTKVVISFTDKGLGHDTLPVAPAGIPTISDTWIPVSERMPEREYVLAADFSGKHYSPCQPNTQVGIYADWFDDGNPTWDDGDGEDLHLKEVTHWMPLPAGPKEVK